MKPLTPTGTRRMIKLLFGSQLNAGRELGYSGRNVRWWCHHGAPPHVQRVLGMLRRNEITLEAARLMLRTERQRRLSLTPGNPLPSAQSSLS